MEKQPTYFLEEPLYSPRRGWYTKSIPHRALELQAGSGKAADGKTHQSASDSHLTVAQRAAVMAKAAAGGEPDVVVPVYEPPGSRYATKRLAGEDDDNDDDDDDEERMFAPFVSALASSVRLT